MKKFKQSGLLELFIAFFKVGLFTIGGGYAMLPMLRKEVVDKHGWATDEEMMDYFAVGQSTPGIIAINTSTFIGYKYKGLVGALFSTLGMVTPSWIIIISIAAFYQEFSDNHLVEAAFSGVRIVVVVLILNAVIKMGKKSLKDTISVLIFLITFFLVALLQVQAIYIIITAAILGIVINSVRNGGAK
ncbi:chromate transporter [Candidatus Izimaplasma bacterium ZiA1]|uniref:chromate transporter n=1 Tax=Candidatus Izimoplasma sp. ZiA1 TaxID=2024899 RepID=UPI000BAA6FF2|nr:chromate transporter [Candidatus Izimaplasma bacterium ZiA1]